MQLNNENDYIPFEPITLSKNFKVALSRNSWKLKFPHRKHFIGKQLMRINLESGVEYEIIRLSNEMLLGPYTQNYDQIRETVKLVSEYVDLELGQNESNVNKRNRVLYLAIMKGKRVGVIGYLEVEPIDRAHKLVIRENDLPSASEEIVPVKMGVCKIWVRSTHRRNGIAKQLMDVSRFTFYDSVIIRKNDVAFIDLCYDGVQFARNYMDGMNNINVYFVQ